MALRVQAPVPVRRASIPAPPWARARDIRTDYVVVSPHNLREPSGLASRLSARLSSLAILIGPLGPLAQGVRIPCIVMAFSSRISTDLKVGLKYRVKPQALRACYAINQFSLCSLGAVSPDPPLH